MANAEHLRILNQGVDAWNKWWRGASDEIWPALRDAVLHDADVVLIEANLKGADLRGINLSGTNLCGANLTDALCDSTIFASLNLSEVKGLDTVRHLGPSTIGLDTLYKSRGKIPV